MGRKACDEGAVGRARRGRPSKNKKDESVVRTGFDGPTAAPWRKTVSIFKQPVTLVITSQRETKKAPLEFVKKPIIKSEFKPFPLLWAKSLEGLSSSTPTTIADKLDLDHVEYSHDQLQLVSKMTKACAVLDDVATAATLYNTIFNPQTPGAFGQKSEKEKIDSNLFLHANPDQPMTTPICISAEEIHAQERKVLDARKRLQEFRRLNLSIGNIVATLYLFLLFCVLWQLICHIQMNRNEEKAVIFLITPTYRRPERLADLTRLSNTLRLLDNIFWIVIEDDFVRNPKVDDLLRSSGVPYVYLPCRTAFGWPKRGWYQRSMGMDWIRKYSRHLLSDGREAVLYFADDDNSYDTRLFNDYIRNVRSVGMWSVGLVGGAPLESLNVTNGKVAGFLSSWEQNTRKFAVDMAGFAINLRMILNSTVVFPKSCKRGKGAPEPCLLEDLGLTLDDIQPFGFDENKTDRDLYVWHTKTAKTRFKNLQNTSTYHFYFEMPK